MALVRSSWSGVGQVGVKTIVGMLEVVQASQTGKGEGDREEGRKLSWQQGYANVLTILTFAPMNGHSLNTLEQEVFMNGIHICFLLCKDEHLPRKGRSS